MSYIDNLFHFYETVESFELHRKQHLISPDSICFIKGSGQIYTQNTLFGICEKRFEELVQLVLSHDVQIEKIIEEINDSIASSESKFKLDSIAPLDVAVYVNTSKAKYSDLDKGFDVEDDDLGLLYKDAEATGSSVINDIVDFIFENIKLGAYTSQENKLRNLRLCLLLRGNHHGLVVLNLSKIAVDETDEDSYLITYSGVDSNNEYTYNMSISVNRKGYGYSKFHLSRVKVDTIEDSEVVVDIKEQVKEIQNQLEWIDA